MEWQQFVAIVLGAIVSGMIGIFIALLSSKMRDRQWERESIIRPLYNELDQLYESGTLVIDDHFKSFWSQLDSYARLRLDKELRKNLNEYGDEILSLQTALEQYDKTKNEVISIFKDTVKHAMANNLSDDGNSIYLEQRKGSSSSIDIGDWLKMFLEILISHKDEHTLAGALITKSENSHWGHEKYFRLWQSKWPNLFIDLSREFQSTEIPEEYNRAFEKVQRLRRQLVSRTESLVKQLLKASKKKW